MRSGETFQDRLDLGDLLRHIARRELLQFFVHGRADVGGPKVTLYRPAIRLLTRAGKPIGQPAK